jgi:hypothetical protein
MQQYWPITQHLFKWSRKFSFVYCKILNQIRTTRIRSDWGDLLPEKAAEFIFDLNVSPCAVGAAPKCRDFSLLLAVYPGASNKRNVPFFSPRHYTQQQQQCINKFACERQRHIRRNDKWQPAGIYSERVGGRVGGDEGARESK